MHDQEWATQSTQIIDFLPKLERAVVEMEKEKRGYLLTGADNFAEAYKRAVGDFYTYNAYLSILVASSPPQSELLAEIRANVESWIKTSAVPAMEAKRTGKDVTALATDDKGEALMGNIRQMLANFEKNELNVY
jgi:CHASE3 domain sensor protein